MAVRKFFLALVLVLALGLTLAASPSQAGKRRYVSIAAGRVGGAYFPVAGAIARTTRRPLKAKGIRVTTESTEGQAASARLTGKGEHDLAILQNVIALEAVQGTKPLFDQPIENLTALCALMPQHVQIFARKEANIKTVADLKGKRLGVGLAGSGTFENCRHILAAWGIDLKDLGKAEHLRAAQAVEYLKTGRLQAAFFTATVGDPVLVNAAALIKLNLVQVEGPEVEKLMAKYPAYDKQTIPAGTYKGNNQNTPTVSVMALLAARADLEEQLVGDILEAVFSHLSRLGRFHPGLDKLSLDKGTIGLSVPLHPGAEKYFKAKGVIQ
ncbi:MAG: TAXI family TRAP transporter solute-binding subunit [Deltaproteobacteria bacterium]|nr:TAXI family TRAP transporter solute-binding subunit [Deltaproteobacteria bacterium]